MKSANHFTREAVKYANQTLNYKSLGPSDPTHPHLGQLPQIYRVFFTASPIISKEGLTLSTQYSFDLPSGHFKG